MRQLSFDYCNEMSNMYFGRPKISNFVLKRRRVFLKIWKTYEITNKEQGNNDKYLVNKWVCQKKYMIILTYKKHAKWMLNTDKKCKSPPKSENVRH